MILKGLGIWIHMIPDSQEFSWIWISLWIQIADSTFLILEEEDSAQIIVCVCVCVCALFCKEFLFLLGLGKLTKLVFTKKKVRKKTKIVKRKLERKKEEDNLTLELVGGPQ